MLVLNAKLSKEMNYNRGTLCY
ncbi:protein of unknown function (plasmid) [Latilactobacillus sakei]|nr:protein of unknown function [Latilactobacillus sakei]